MRALVVGFGLLGTVIAAHAQCPTRPQFHAELRAITTLGNSNPTSAQQRLRGWLFRWQQCHDRADSSYVTALNQLAYLHMLARDFPPAIRYARQAVALYKKPNLRLKCSDLAKSYYRLGVYLDYAGESEKAIMALTKATEVTRREAGVAQWAAAAYPYIAYFHYTQGDYEKALLYADQGEKVALSLGEEVSRSKLLQQKSQALAELGRTAEAQQAIEAAIALISQHPEQYQSYASQERQLGAVMEDLGLADQSLKHYLLGYRMARTKGHENLSDFANSLGQYYYRQGDYGEALAYYQEALQIDKSRYSKSVLLDNMGMVYRQLGQFDTALRYHQRGLTELSIAFTDTLVASLPPAVAIRAEPQKEYFLVTVQDKADTWLRFAQRTHNDPARLRHALRTYMLADSLIDYMRREHTEEGSKLYWRQKTRTMYEHAIQTCHLLRDPVAALYFFEKSRVVLLTDKLNELSASQRLAIPEAKKEKELRRRISELQSQLNHKILPDTSISTLRTALLEAQKTQERFFKSLAITNPQYYRYKYDNSVPSLADLRRTLGKKTTFITYFFGDSALYGIGVNHEKMIFRKLNRTAYLRDQRQFNALLISRERQNQRMDQFLRTAHALYQTLVLPFQVAEGENLVISPDGDFISFAAFSLSARKPDYLVRHHALSYTYSARLLQLRPQAAESDGWRDRSFLGIAPVRFEKALHQVTLTGSDEALYRIKRHFWFAKNLIGQAATRRAFVEQAPDYRIVQLFTHASADSISTPQLYFADSALSLPDLATVRPFRTQLMVLSACQTALGKNQRGEGVFSLARGFAGLGVPTTLTTLWSVENQAIFGLTRLFYQKMANHLPLDEALRQAQIEWLDTASRRDQLPYAWAGLVLVGQRAPLLDETPYYGWVAATLLLVLAGGGLLFWKRRQA